MNTFSEDRETQEQEYCPTCKSIQQHNVLRTKMRNGTPWRKGECRKCGARRALPLTAEDRKQSGLDKPDFYRTASWLRLRYEVLREQGFRCAGCRRSDVELHVDHIEPRSKCPERELDKANMQVLCVDCNFGKSNRYRDNIAEVRMKQSDLVPIGRGIKALIGDGDGPDGSAA